MRQVAVILAAGKSTRMQSRIPKAAHPVLGRPMLAHVLFAAHAALNRSGTEQSDDTPPASENHQGNLFVILGHEAEAVNRALQNTPECPAYHVALQSEALGTGDAVRAAQSLVEGAMDGHPAGTVLVLYGDSPLVRAETLAELLTTHERAGATVTFLTGHANHNTGYGRIIRGETGRVLGIVEERHCSPEQLRIAEVNSGIYCFQAGWLWNRLEDLIPHTSGEYYLTDLVDLAAAEGARIETITAPLSETAGVNDRIQLAEAEAVLRRRTMEALMRSGVTVVDPTTTYVEASVRIGMDTTILPFTTLHGETVIGENCTIGPYSSLHDSIIGDGCTVAGSWLEGATMDPGSRIGPMGHLRPGAHLETGVYMGNFGEVKNARIGRNVKMHHFGFVGDADIGDDTNIGAGVITVNYDGTAKHRTSVGNSAFLGCDTLLIAPVTVGDDATTGAGSVVTRPVPDGGVAVGVPARVIRRKQPRSATQGAANTHHAAPATSSPAPITRHDSRSDRPGNDGEKKELDG